mgnify:CR=1 FL=1
MSASDSAARPRLSRASTTLTFSVSAQNERGERVATAIAGERPLTLYLDKRELVTLMTLGQAPEALALGYLRNQRLATRLEEIESVQVDWETGACAITTRGGIGDVGRRLAKRTVTTGCGQGTVFGDLMEELDALELDAGARLAEPTLHGLLENIRKRETIYREAGAVHGCALAAGTELVYFIEDVGRHNAVDAIAGLMWLDGVAGDDKIFYTTGRLTSEMVIKCAQMRVPILISRSGLTQMGYEIARKVGLTMIGRATGRHYLLFTGAHRFLRSSVAASQTPADVPATPGGGD